MPRAMLAYPLILALAVGPLLCCCTAGRVLGSPAPVTTPSPRSVPASKPAALSHSCCAHKQQKQDQKPASPKPAPSKPGQCPCKDGASKVQATPSPVSPADQLEQSRAISQDFLSTVAGTDVLVSPTEGVNCARCGSACLSPSVSELLFSHHKLRC